MISSLFRCSKTSLFADMTVLYLDDNSLAIEKYLEIYFPPCLQGVENFMPIKPFYLVDGKQKHLPKQNLLMALVT